MKIKDQVILNNKHELKVFYYNVDPKSPDHDVQAFEAGTQFTIMGYVLDKSNQLIQEEVVENVKDYAFVIRHNLLAELFRVSHAEMTSNFQVI